MGDVAVRPEQAERVEEGDRPLTGAARAQDLEVEPQLADQMSDRPCAGDRVLPLVRRLQQVDVLAQPEPAGQHREVGEHAGVQGVRGVRREPDGARARGAQLADRRGQVVAPGLRPARVGVAEHLQVGDAGEARLGEHGHRLHVGHHVGHRRGAVAQRQERPLPRAPRPVRPRGREVDRVEGVRPLLERVVDPPADLRHTRELQVGVGVDQPRHDDPGPAELLRAGVGGEDLPAGPDLQHPAAQHGHRAVADRRAGHRHDQRRRVDHGTHTVSVSPRILAATSTAAMAAKPPSTR